MNPIKQTDMPPGRKATYVKFVSNIRPQKAETHRTRLTVGGNLIKYPGNTSTPTADMTTAKLLINSTISEPGAKWVGIDLKDFYLNTKMKRREYIKIQQNLIPNELIEQYKLNQYTTNEPTTNTTSKRCKLRNCYQSEGGTGHSAEEALC